MNGVDARVNFRCIFEGFGKIIWHYNRQEKKAQNDRILCLFLIPVLVSEEILQKILQVNLKYVLFSIFLLWISSFTSLKKSGNVNVSSVILCPIFLSITLIIALLY